MTDRLRYVALGDSYTIGTAVLAADRWPDRLVAELAGEPVSLDLVANLGVSGFTSDDVIAIELPQFDGLRPDFASLLIGVNDVVRGVPVGTYRANLAVILDTLLDRLAADRLVLVTTPDYTVTPAGAHYGEVVVRRAAIARCNEIEAEEAGARGIALVDIFDISGRVADAPDLVAGDGLHPSGHQYALWVARIAPVVATLLAPRPAGSPS
jgi:lysophospholipase L1-like esterase